MTLNSSAVRVLSLRGEPVPLSAIAPRTIVALEDAHGDALGVGLVDEVDDDGGVLAIRASVHASKIVTVRVGEATAE